MLSERELQESPLFRNISYEEYRRMVACFQAVLRRFHSEELVYDFYGSKTDAIGIVERGAASVIRIDREGVSTVLEELGPGDVFGRTLAFSDTGEDSLEVICRTPCDVLFIDYAHIMKRCGNACTCHSVLVQNMLQLMLEKARALSQRVDVLSRRTIREKLLCCFRHMAEKEKSASFTLPFSLSTMADYIAADRSAMMRELKRLREEGVLRSDGRRFTLL